MAEAEPWTIDRLEGDLAVLEVAPHRLVQLPRALLPEAAGEGDTLQVRVRRDQDQSAIELRRDTTASSARAQRNAARVRRLKGRDPGGDLSL